MNVVWLSPVDAESSEIARYSEQILPFLAQHAGIAAVENGTDGASPSWSPAGDASTETVQGQAPLPVYHIGNNPVHIPIYQRSLEEPGLVVLHDLSLVDLAKNLSHQLEQPNLWKQLMCRQYGDDISGLVNRSENSVADHNEMVANYPLFEPFVAGALGIIVHSRYARDIILGQSATLAPVRQLNLPGHPGPDPATERDHSAALRFVFCGHVGPNRRLIEFFEAWGELDSPELIRVDLFGNIRNRRQLLQYADHFGVAEYLTLRGYVSDAELDQALHSADFAINLRWPTMGEASASQLRYWAAGLPALVSDVGWYRELPDETVCKISIDNERDDIRSLLEDALVSPGKYRQIGQQGRDYLRRNHAPEHYARELAGFAEELCSERLAYRTLDRQLVQLVASMCENETDTGLFRGAIETAVATLAPSLGK
jgi:glycosyltransferase involved in cell wall biosynthesis